MGITTSIGNYINHLSTVLNNITNNSVLGKLGIVAGSAITAVIAPISGLLIACFSTTVVDMIYGIAVAKKQKKKITSDKNWHGTLMKLVNEFTLLFLARVIEYTILGTGGVFVLTGGVAVILSLTELWSIIENLNTLYPNGPWKALGAFLKKKGEDYTGVELHLGNEHTDDHKMGEGPLENRREGHLRGADGTFD